MLHSSLNQAAIGSVFVGYLLLLWLVVRYLRREQRPRPHED